MERPKNLSTNRAIRLQNKRTIIAVRLIVLFHLVGLTGLSLSFSKPLFLQLIPYHLLLMALVLFFSNNKISTKFLYFFSLIFITGFTVEWLGVHTGLLFGNYTYGKTLGIQAAGIPLIMGVNWFLLIYTIGGTIQQMRIKSVLARVLLGALLLVLLDVLIEPVAMRLNYWQWQGNSIPVNNYVCWFIVSAILLFVFEKFNFKKQTLVGSVFLACQFIFFAALQ